MSRDFFGFSTSLLGCPAYEVNLADDRPLQRLAPFVGLAGMRGTGWRGGCASLSREMRLANFNTDGAKHNGPGKRLPCCLGSEREKLRAQLAGKVRMTATSLPKIQGGLVWAQFGVPRGLLWGAEYDIKRHADERGGRVVPCRLKEFPGRWMLQASRGFYQARRGDVPGLSG